MNYLRGAVNAISAPYQYYKDLPPINPSTLTGAIDVIVVQRPTDSGGTELACTPFHVRFGKWQVLRPGEKKVDVSINGHRIPFNMKIGEAGEAFFVFETEDDVPDNLTTSPIIQPTADEQPRQEPDFLDLNAAPPKQHQKTLYMPSAPSREDQSVEAEQDKRADHVLSQVVNSVEPPQVDYADGLAIDVEGYHQGHARERSDRTIKLSEMYSFPTGSSTEEVDEDDEDDSEPAAHTLPIIRATSEPPPHLEADADQDPSQASTSTSQQGLTNLNIPAVQEYSWDWGAFPQPSPMKVSFGKGGRIEPPLSPAKNAGTAMTWGKSVSKDKEWMKYNAIDQVDEKESTEGGRSRSVPPPDLLANPKRRRHKSLYTTYPEGSWIEETPQLSTHAVEGEYGLGGRLSVSKSDPSLFRVSLDGKRALFELSLVSSEIDDVDDQENQRGRRGRDGSFGGVTLFSEMSGVDDFELSQRFDKGKVTFDKFLEDETVISDPRLVIRWAGSQYLTRHDESPLMRALVIWRDDYLREKATGKISSRPSSPISDEEDVVKDESAPQQEPSTSSSWVQWWKRSRRTKNDGRPELNNVASSPAGDVKSVPKAKPIHPADSAPALPSTPIQQPVRETTPLSTSVSESQVQKHKYVKTLRLTSDQLKSLNLKPGANTMTFALSSTGTIACAARIFVWDSTDLVVVSDIDGTITKSDGLGHVFAMIGRDWTHLGVAKLYTDITRNGYKIMYLTSRAIGQADATRGYLRGIKQNDYQLPEGPVIMSPDRLMASLHREVIMRKPEVFKMACLRDILRVFGEGSRNPFYAGFGNRITDALSYRSVNVPSSRIFTIDPAGEVKLELLELAGYKSSYIHMTDLVDQMFPPIHRKWTPEYTDFNYWKTPVPDYPLPDLSPPSPTLSARSDTSNQSTLARLRNFSLVGGRQANVPKAMTSSERSPDLLKMSSFERLSNTLTFSGSLRSTPRRSLSPGSMSSTTFADSDDEEEFDYDEEGKRRRRQRTRSMTSMPGSLEDMPLDDEPDQDISDMENGMIDDEVAEEAFDEDLLATGEMQNVPFL